MFTPSFGFRNNKREPKLLSNSRTWWACCWTIVILVMIWEHWHSFLRIRLIWRSLLCSTARYCTVVLFFTAHAAKVLLLVLCLFYTADSSQMILRKRMERPNPIKHHHPSAIAWKSCVRTSSLLKLYMKIMMMFANLLNCCSFQGSCPRIS